MIPAKQERNAGRVAVSDSQTEKGQKTPKAALKQYVKPSFRSEKVFETMALACGKTGPTQASCTFNRKKS